MNKASLLIAYVAYKQISTYSSECVPNVLNIDNLINNSS